MFLDTSGLYLEGFIWTTFCIDSEFVVPGGVLKVWLVNHHWVHNHMWRKQKYCLLARKIIANLSKIFLMFYLFVCSWHLFVFMWMLVFQVFLLPSVTILNVLYQFCSWITENLLASAATNGAVVIWNLSRQVKSKQGVLP